MSESVDKPVAMVRRRPGRRVVRLAALVFVLGFAGWGIFAWNSVDDSRHDLRRLRERHEMVRGIEDEVRLARGEDTLSRRRNALERAIRRISDEREGDGHFPALTANFMAWRDGADPKTSEAEARRIIEQIHVGIDQEAVRVEAELTQTLSKLYASLVGSLVLGVLTLLTLGRTVMVEARLEHSERRARQDSVIGGMNRRGILEQAHHEWSRACRYGHPIVVLMVDLDHFKQVNDRHGHAAGDVVLKTVAERMRERLRPYDACGRLGGDEFLVVLPDCDAQTAGDIASRLKRACEEWIDIGLERARVSASIGGAVTTAHGGTLEALIAKADEALYAVKSRGRNDWRIVETHTEKTEEAGA